MTSARSILRSASMVSIGTAAGQLVSFGAALVLVRIYAPATMGVFSTLVAVVTTLAPLASGRFELAIPLPKKDRSAVTLGRVAVTSAACWALLIAAVLVLLGILEIEVPIDLSVGTWAVPAVLLTLVFYLSANQLAVRFGSYIALALRGFLYPLVLAISQVSLGVLHFGAEGLVIGLLIAHLVTAFTLWVPMERRARKTKSQSDGWRNLARTYKRFPIYLSPAGVVNSLSITLPQLGIAFIFGMAEAGQFAMMAQILSVPVALVGQSIGYVYVGEVAKLQREGRASVVELYDQLSLRLAIVSGAMLIGVVAFAEPVFTWLLGEAWRGSGVFAALYVIAPAARLIAIPVSQTLILAGRTRIQLTIDVCRAASIILAFFAMWMAGAAVETTILVVGITSAIGYLAIWILNRRVSSRLTVAQITVE